MVCVPAALAVADDPMLLRVIGSELLVGESVMELNVVLRDIGEPVPILATVLEAVVFGEPVPILATVLEAVVFVEPVAGAAELETVDDPVPPSIENSPE